MFIQRYTYRNLVERISNNTPAIKVNLNTITHGKINFITLSVRDLALAERFYTSVFGFPVSERSDALCLFELEDNFSLVLQQQEDFLNQVDYTDKDGLNSPGFILSQYAASKEAVDTLIAKAIAHGAQKVKVMDEPWAYSVTFKDPDGHHWEIVHIIQKS